MDDGGRAARWRVRWPLVSLAAGGLVGVACMGGVERVYVDGGSAPGPDGSTPDVSAKAAGDDGEMPAEGSAGDGAGPIEASDDAGAEAAPLQDAAPPDAAPPDAPPDAPSQVFTCNGATVTSCAACTNNPLDCVFCGQAGSHPGVCGPKNQLCDMSAPQNATVCNCPNNSVQTCPFSLQTCTPIAGQYYCQTCGEQGSDQHPCKGGGTCHATTGTCY